MRFKEMLCDVISHTPDLNKECGYNLVRVTNVKTYLMKDDNTGYVKIGRSQNPTGREKTLQSEKPTINLIYVCNEDIEKILHNMFSEKRIRGEWFSLTDEDINYIVERFRFQELNLYKKKR